MLFILDSTSRALSELRYLLMLIVFSTGLGSAVWAQVAPPANYDQKLGDVVVNATRSGTPLDQLSLIHI